MNHDPTPVMSPSQPGAAEPAPRRSGDGGGLARRAKKLERSCILCHRRKIKCDKKSPCSTCTRTGVLCCYPASEQPIRRPRKTTIADVAERLVRLERTLVAISSTDAPPAETETETGTPSYSESAAQSTSGNASESASVVEEFLLQNGGKTCYMNEVLISRVLEEEDELRSALGAQETPRNDVLADADDGETFQALDLGGLLSGFSPPSADFLDLHPEKWQALQLWQTFVSVVELVNKVLHIPTTSLVVFKAIDNPAAAPPDVNCLMFSVYFSAVTAMTDDAVERLLGHRRRRALSTFRRGLEISLIQSNFLEAPSLTALQAMALFLQTVRAHNTGRSVWVLNGLVIRAAQSVGLHRDGTTLGLSIFDTEMRRRLWWCIFSNDSRVAEDHSITVNSFDPSTNVGFPSNVDDAQLYPGMAALPEARGRWTEMSLPLIMKEICIARRQLYQVLPPLQATVGSEAVRREIVEKVKAKCEEEYFRYCNPIVPQQRAAELSGRSVLEKLDFVSRLQWLSMANQHTTRGLLSTDETLAEACRILEYGTQVQTDELLRDYRWCVEIYPQYHVLLYVLWRLCVKPTGPSVERAWKQVDANFRLEYAQLGFETAPPGSKWAVLKAFREKALQIRQMVADGKVPVKGKAVALEVPAGDASIAAGDVGLDAGGMDDGFSWNPEDAGLPDWNDLVEDLKMDGFEMQI